MPEEVGYTKVFEMLKSGGVFARFANRPYTCKNEPELAAKIDSYYAEYYNKFHKKESKPRTEFTEEKAIELAAIAEKYGFTDIRHAMFYRERVFTAKEYLELLGTYSDHIAIEESIRNEFFAKIENAINEAGGTITITDTMDLELARK